MSPDEPMLEVRGLRKSYGEVVALAGVDLEVATGEIVALVGPNGAGKTTLVSIVAGLRRADAGSVRVGGVDAAAHPVRAQALTGLAPQDTGIYPVVTVAQNLRLFGRLAGLRGRDLEERVATVAARLRITDLLDRQAGKLSAGQKRRLHTAMALVHHPPLLLLDEATTGADVETRAQVLDLLRDLAAEGSAVLYSTHYLHEVEALGGSVTIIDEGRVIARGEVSELVNRHGGAAVEMRFQGPPPVVEGAEQVGDDTLWIATDRPGVTTAAVVQGLGESASRLESIEIVRPSLETVYLNLTGRRFRQADLEGADAAA